ncbi:YceI family protein [Leekyejoonella antrihumi]|uniref:YceI family protein n=1 Tax=Leekyejoonella antrihumi TaxID=1660198 RepID=A0A563DXL9_9MICO|nr:YceI family protein [Leekyejoonella antrihumi]TWP34702.1 YceI family protein [Leekyejoonella antrihumi]
MSTLTDLTPGVWTVDAAHSEVAFVARHLMVTKVRGKFEQFEADVKVGEQLEDSSVSATVQMVSVKTGSEDRDKHLRTNDFFEIDTYPTMTFNASNVTSRTLEGDLTIKGVTQRVTFDLEFGGVSPDPWGGTRAGFEATTTIRRKEFGLTFNVPVEGGGALVSEKIDIVLDIQLVKA